MGTCWTVPFNVASLAPKNIASKMILEPSFGTTFGIISGRSSFACSGVKIGGGD